MIFLKKAVLTLLCILPLVSNTMEEPNPSSFNNYAELARNLESAFLSNNREECNNIINLLKRENVVEELNAISQLLFHSTNTTIITTLCNHILTLSNTTQDSAEFIQNAVPLANHFLEITCIEGIRTLIPLFAGTEHQRLYRTMNRKIERYLAQQTDHPLYQSSDQSFHDYHEIAANLVAKIDSSKKNNITEAFALFATEHPSSSEKAIVESFVINLFNTIIKTLSDDMIIIEPTTSAITLDCPAYIEDLIASLFEKINLKSTTHNFDNHIYQLITLLQSQDVIQTISTGILNYLNQFGTISNETILLPIVAKKASGNLSNKKRTLSSTSKVKSKKRKLTQSDEKEHGFGIIISEQFTQICEHIPQPTTGIDALKHLADTFKRVAIFSNTSLPIFGCFSLFFNHNNGNGRSCFTNDAMGTITDIDHMPPSLQAIIDDAIEYCIKTNKHLQYCIQLIIKDLKNSVTDAEFDICFALLPVALKKHITADSLKHHHLQFRSFNYLENQKLFSFDKGGNINQICILNEKCMLGLDTMNKFATYEFSTGTKTVLDKHTDFLVMGNKPVTVSGASIKIWDLDSGKVIKELPTKKLYHIAAYKELFVTLQKKRVQIFDNNTCKLLKSFKLVHKADQYSFCCLNDKTFIITHFATGSISVYDIHTGNLLHYLPTQIKISDSNMIHLLDDHKSLLLFNQRGDFKIFDVNSGTEIYHKNFGEGYYCCLQSIGKLILVLKDGIVYFLDYSDQNNIIELTQQNVDDELIFNTNISYFESIFIGVLNNALYILDNQEGCVKKIQLPVFCDSFETLKHHLRNQ